jgi:hypothetical protein
VSVSRGIVEAHDRLGGDPLAAAGAEAARLRELAWETAHDRWGAGRPLV